MTRILSLLLGLVSLDLVVAIAVGATPLHFVLAATLAAVLLLLRFRWLAPRRMQGGRLVLFLLLLPTLVQFQLAGGRINGDGVMYYVYVRSLGKDLDLDLTNEYTHYGLITRGDLSVPTKTGLRRSIFAIGPAVVGMPFFLAGEAVARVQQALTGEADLTGYGPCHRNLVALGGLLYGFLAIVLIHEVLLRHFVAATALGASLLLWGATFLHWYMVQQPTTSHAPSAFCAALAIWLWDRDRVQRTLWGYFLLGLALGVAMCVRWQNGVLLILPGLELLARLRRDGRAALRTLAGAGALVGAGALIGAFPQMAAWKAIYDMWVLPYPPHGTDFVRLDHPFVLETFFSSRHGLLSWTPVCWVGYLGFFVLLRRRPQLGWPLLVPLLLMTYVNLCSGDWWAGGSYSNRRFDSLLPLFALGLAAAIDVARATLRATPRLAVAGAAVPFVLWNGVLVEQVRRGLVPFDDTVAFPTLVGHGARLVADAVGSPTTWPASWLFAWQQGRPPGQYDRLVGRYLFYRQNNMQGHVAVAAPGEEAMLGEGFGPITLRDGVPVRAAGERARLFAPLDVPEELELRVKAQGEGTVSVRVNACDAGAFLADQTLREHRVRAAASCWRRELNDVVLLPAGELWVNAVDFVRVGRP